MERYRLSNAADADFSKLYSDGIVDFGLEQAQAYALGLYDLFQTLGENPLMGYSAKELAPELRRFPYQSHVIFYLQYNDDGVFIVRILRKEMDFRPLLLTE